MNFCDDFDTPYDAFRRRPHQGRPERGVAVAWVAATPTPPTKGDNTWVLRIRDASGSPLPDAEVTDVRPFMPNHGHGSTIVPTSAPLYEPTFDNLFPPPRSRASRCAC
jgi:hypothetical protein